MCLSRRRPRPPRWCAVLALLAGTGGVSAQDVDTLSIRAHSYFLSGDELAGRGAGTEGERVAARYLAAALARTGLAPAGTEGFFQSIPLAELRVDPVATRLELRRSGEVHRYDYGTDFVLRPGGRGTYRDLAGPLLFVGEVDARSGRADLDVGGRILVLTEPVGPAAAHLVARWEERGAAGVLALVTDPSAFVRERARAGNGHRLLDADVQAPVWQASLPVVVAGPALSMAVLADSAPGALGTPLRPGPLEQRISLHVAARFEPVPARNVAGLLVGSDPERRNEFVVYTAHYDHLGTSGPGPDSIFNGFSDNAAGVAMLLSIAESMHAAPPARSVLFLFPTAEETGLLGSTYFAHDPTVPLDAIAAVINLDGGAPPAPPMEWELAGGAASTIGETARGIADREGWSVRLTAPRPNSDYWPFALRGVPALFLIPGRRWEGVSDADRARLVGRWERYHQPGDEWAPDFPMQGLRRYARFALQIGLAVANADGRPRLLVGDGRR